ncbi:hypothetical protein BH09SUM1_BH09SUM1_27560 [soil metagenome]
MNYRKPYLLAFAAAVALAASPVGVSFIDAATPAATPRVSNTERRHQERAAKDKADAAAKAAKKTGAPTKPAAAPAPAAAPKPAATPAPAPAAAPAVPSGPALGDYSLKVNTDARMLRLSPEGKEDRSDVTLILGQELVTNVTFDNKSQHPFDGIRVILSYEPELLEPLAINDKPIAGNIPGTPTAEVDSRYGLLLYEAKLSQPIIMSNEPLLTIRWKTKKVSASTRIEFSSRDEFHTTLTDGPDDILGNPKDPNDGTLDMNVIILPEDPREAEALLTDPAIFQKTDAKIGGVQLSFLPPTTPIVAGEPFDVDVVLDNRAFSMMDGLGLLIGYDPDVIRIIDSDKDNWITRETNILDGPFRKDYPWDFQIDNTVYPTRGQITYRMGSSDGEVTRGKTGTVARIHAVALRPTGGTALKFLFSNNPRVHGTEATYVGEDTLGDPKVKDDGTKNLTLQVEAPRVSTAMKASK